METKTIKTAGVLILKEDKILLVQHDKKAKHLNNIYGIPAGRIEENESPIETAIRELHEETGLITNVNLLQKIPKKYSATIKQKDGTNTFSLEVFLCNNWKGELKSTKETIPEWISINDLDKIQLLPNVKKIIFDGMELEKSNRY